MCVFLLNDKEELIYCKRANGLRYPLVGGTRQHYFDGTNLKPRKTPENALTPTSRVHAVLGALTERQPSGSITDRSLTAVSLGVPTLVRNYELDSSSDWSGCCHPHS
jgi:hypothetical protein